MLGNRAHEGLQPPSNLEKGKDSKKPSTRPTYAVRPVRTPSDPRGDLRLARGLPAGALDRARASASLEGSEPPVGEADRLRLA